MTLSWHLAIFLGVGCLGNFFGDIREEMPGEFVLGDFPGGNFSVAGVRVHRAVGLLQCDDLCHHG